MGQILATVATAVGGITAVLTFIDWYLTETQKKLLSNISLRCWNWIDELQKKQNSFRLDRGRPQLGITVVSQLFLIAYVVESYLLIAPIPSHGPPSDTSLSIVYWSLISASLFGANIYVVPVLLRWCARSRYQIAYVVRLFWTILLILVIISLSFMAIFKVVMVFDIDLGAGSQWWQVGEFPLVVLFILATEFLAILMVASFAIVPLLLCKGLLLLSEKVMRKIAESPTGPLLAISTIVGLVGALAKTFGA